MPKTPTTVLIVDDEPLGREVVRHMLAVHSDFAIVGECGDGEKALAAIKRLGPQLVFLDVQMPKIDGLSLLERLRGDKRPFVVLVTAHDQYAVRAFQADAVDYLLKPFDQERFDGCLTRIRRRLEQGEEARLGKSLRDLMQGNAAGDTARTFADRLVIRENGRVFFVGTEEIRWLEAAGNYVEVHVDTGKAHLVHETMASMEEKLDPALFLRVHRSTIVNIARIKELQPHLNGEYIIVLKDGGRVKLSRGYLEQARTRLGLD